MTNNHEMTDARYRHLLDAYGADFERWPAHERTAGKAYRLASSEARARHQEAEALDQALALVAPEEPSAGLLERIEQIPSTMPLDTVPVNYWAGARWKRTVLGLAAAAALGLVAGNFSSVEFVDGAASVQQEDWDVLTDLAFATYLQEDSWQ